ncbi:xanthine/CO dehydrogenase XdhC/CoxF family maturation factor [Evansella vedderi]|uniref:Xanthine/CO dehydrogenase XdhC/CoxF family maturation factor n=1 Tax=Evansella vedderi TaxID=38282 RepID=A0ABT9ZR05_9BACI|nr:XdhC/CoxI family protein [Evansella vedderi]MDQ0253385.1 xanthine/CO dehydrogenase XdhC/CoxF family maturation factor [Evansella vedderi]
MKNRKKAVIATIINKEGSTYRQVGAKSIFHESGKVIGVLSGGCVEEDLFEYCKDVMETGQSKTIYYNFQEEDPLLDLNVGCHGAMTIFLQLFDPINSFQECQQLLNNLSKLLVGCKPINLVTIVDSEDEKQIPIGTCFEPNADYYYFNEFKILKSLHEQPLSIMHSPESNTILETFATNGWINIKVNCYIEKLEPIPRLIVFGAGPDVIPVVKGAKLLDWHVTVVDHRPGYANKDIFPDADKIFLIEPGKPVEDIHVSENACTVIMSHHFQQDMLYLKYLLKQHPFYIGLLGARHRSERLIHELQSQEGIFINANLEEKLHYPVGINIGAESPGEIAMSILSEMMLKRNQKNGKPLKNTVGPIHCESKNTNKILLGVNTEE